MRLGFGLFIGANNGVHGGAAPNIVYLPSDVDNLNAVYSPYLLVQGYDGPLMTVCATAATDTPAASIDVYPDANGAPDYAAAITAYGDNFDVWKIYDQCGNHDPITQGTATRRPEIVPEYSGWFSAGNTTRFDLPASVTVSRRSMCEFAVAAGPNQYGSGTQGAHWGHSTTNSGSSYMNLITGDRGVVALGGAFAISENPMFETPTVIGYNGSASASRVIRDVQVRSLTAQADVTGITGGYIGAAATGYQSAVVRYWAHVLYTATLSTDDEAAVVAALKERFNIPTYTAYLHCFGDSVTFGQQATRAKNMEYYLVPQLPETCAVINLGRPGQGIVNELTVRTQTRLNAQVVPDATNIALIHIGSNDIESGQTDTQVMTNINTLVDRLQTAGFDAIFIGHCLDRASFDTTKNGYKDGMNASIDSTAESEGFIPLPWQEITIAMDPDATHPSSAGYEAMADLAAPLINAVLS